MVRLIFGKSPFGITPPTFIPPWGSLIAAPASDKALPPFCPMSAYELLRAALHGFRLRV